MKWNRFFLLFILLSFFWNGCSYFSSVSTYKKEAEETMNALIQADYDKVMNNMAWNHPAFQNVRKEDFKRGIVSVHDFLEQDFKAPLKLSVLQAGKGLFPLSKDASGEGLQQIVFEISDGNMLGVVDMTFDEQSGKLINVHVRDSREPKPDMFFFWLFGLLTLCVPIFNIYVISLIRKSKLKRKWLKYLAVIFFNVPSLVYLPINGFSIELFSFQLLLGIGVHYMNYLGAAWAVGIPLGGLYWYWKLKKLSFQKNEGTDEIIK